MAAMAGSAATVGRVSSAAQSFVTLCQTTVRKTGRVFVQNVADPEVLRNVADAVPVNRQNTAPAVSRIPRVLTMRSKSGKPTPPREWPQEPQEKSKARRLVEMPFIPIKKLGRSISNSKLAAAFFYSGEPPSKKTWTANAAEAPDGAQTPGAQPKKTRTTDTIPEEITIICNADMSSEAEPSSPGLKRSGSSLLRRLSLKPLRMRRSSSLAEKSPKNVSK